jgi:hypothetical protein
MNMCVPFIDDYTQPRVFGHPRSDRKGEETMTPAMRETLSTALTLLVISVIGASLLAGAYT